MSAAHPLGDFSALFAALAAAGVGSTAIWSNPRRPINRVFFSVSLHVSLWLLCLYLAFTAEPNSEDGLFWYRITSAVGALIHFHLWLVRETVAHRTESFAAKVYRGRRWLLAGACLAALCFMQWFIPTPEAGAASVRHYHGIGFYGFWAGVVGVYISLCAETLKKMRVETGVQRMELQLLLLGGSAAALVVMFLMLLGAVLGLSWVVRLQPFIVLLFYTATVIAMTTSRVFNARQLLFVGGQKCFLVTIIAVASYGLDVFFSELLPGPPALFATVGVALWLASLLKEWLDRWFEFYPQGKTARQAAFAAAQRERRAEDLERAFTAVLTGWGHSERALILSGNKQIIGGGAIELDGNGAVVKALRYMRWATPERLARERPTVERIALEQFMTEKQLGVVVLEEGLALTVLIGVGVGASRRPFTYPQVTQLMELASIMESALERAHFSAKIQHTEQLATVGLLGASLAHEIRNPLVSIKTFVQLLPTHHHDPVFRDKFFKLIGDEVGRIDQLTEQLLDLSSPRSYAAEQVELHPLLRSSLDLVAAKAAHRDVKFLTEFEAAPDRAFTDASAAKQVMLNLCFNAIQAVDSHATTERWVKIATRNTSQGIEMAVADSGPGIAPEIRPRLFQPFQTTKSSGFGLGLAICSDILANLNASITVDAPEPGRGATFRVTFPCQP